MADTSPRTLIRNWATQKIVALGLPGVKIFDARAKRIDQTLMPCVLIYTKDEQAVVLNKAPRIYKRTLRLAVEVFVKADDTELDDELDAFANQVEQKLLTFQQNDVFSFLDFVGAEYFITQEGNKAHGSVILDFDVVYETQHTSDLTEFQNFTKYISKIDPAPDEDRPAISSEVDLPTE